MLHLKLGTRRSLLAMSQSAWVAREIEKNNPGVAVELVGIETTGDRVLDVPLSKIEGKEFFVAELDTALKEGRVHFNVHSMKDLSLDRPSEFLLAAIPKRENPRDVVIFSPDILDRLKNGEEVLVGTSSPRRLENIPALLSQLLPNFSGRPPSLKFVEIRGNVNTRLSRLHAQDAQKKLHAVVLAFAGLARLHLNEEAKQELLKLQAGTRMMVLPLRENPTAPAQGALAVECRRDDAATIEALRKIHSESSEKEIQIERQLLRAEGGGCHQRFGATALTHPQVGQLLFVRGKSMRGEALDRQNWVAPEKVEAGHIWDGKKWRSESEAVSLKVQSDAVSFKQCLLFISHSRALKDMDAKKFSDHRLWTSGVESWKKLAGQGLWIEGCTEEFGYDFYRPLLESAFLNLPKQMVVFTHADAIAEWNEHAGVTVIATYKTPAKEDGYPKQAIEELKKADLVYWSSGSQFELLRNHAKKGAIHCVSVGKSCSKVKAQLGNAVLVFPNHKEWKAWVE